MGQPGCSKIMSSREARYVRIPCSIIVIEIINF